MVVVVLITSCQVSEKPNIGPLTPQTMMAVTARKNTQGLPTAVDTLTAILWNKSFIGLYHTTTCG